MEGTGTLSGGNSESASAPLTFEQAFAADASPAPEQSSSESTTTPAAEQPGSGQETSPQQQDERSPFIPRVRFDEVNTKKAELEQQLQDWQQYGWAKQVDPQEFSRVVEIARKSASDPIGYLQDFIKELQADPNYGAQLRSLAARALAQRTHGAPAQETEPQPDLPIQLEDGRVVHLYSAEQQAKREAFLQKQWLQSVQQELQPLKQTHEQLQAEKAAVQKQQEITQFVTTTFEDVKTWPGMDDKANQAKVAQALAQMSLTSDDPREVSLALNAAYRREVLPTLSQRAETSLLDNLKQKAAAASSVNPGSAAPSTPRKPTGFYDSSLQWS